MMTTTGKQFTLTDKDSLNVCYNNMSIDCMNKCTPHQGQRKAGYPLVEERRANDDGP